MIDKHIIIDGVDVGRCEHYEDLNCFAYRDCCGYPLDCKDNPNCYYKQLKHKEQECEELKKKCNIYTCGIYGNKEDCNKLYNTITEIKEIALGVRNYLNYPSPRDVRYEMDIILQKISEVV